MALRRRSRVNRWLDPLLMLPLGASAVTLGLGFMVVFNRPPLDVRSFPLLIPIAHSLVALPFVVRTLQPALASIPANLRQAAAVLGALALAGLAGGRPADRGAGGAGQRDFCLYHFAG